MEIKELYKKFLKAKGADPKYKNQAANKKIDVSKRGLWDRKKKQVIVPSNRITMKGPNGERDFFKKPVVATGLQSGQKVVMQPGGEYYFPNDRAVHEVRMQNGGETSTEKNPERMAPVDIRVKRKKKSDSYRYRYDENGNLVYTPTLQIYPKMEEGSLEGGYERRASLPVDALNPTLEEFTRVAAPYYPIDNQLTKDTKINLSPSKFQNELEQDYVLPQYRDKSFGDLPLNKDDGYAPSRRWATNLNSQDLRTQYGKDGYGYVLKTDPENLASYDKKYEVENQLSRNDQAFKDYLAANGYDINTIDDVTKKYPDQIWNRAEQMRVESMNNKEIRDWAKLHNVDLSRKKTLTDNANIKEGDVEGDDRFASKIPESMYANRLADKGLASNRPDYDYGLASTYIVQDPSKFKLADYFPVNEYTKEAEKAIPGDSTDYQVKLKRHEFVKNKIAEKMNVDPSAFDKGEYLLHYNQSPITEYTPGFQDGGTIQTDMGTPIRQKNSPTQDAFDKMMDAYEARKTEEPDTTTEDMGFREGGNLPVVIDSLFSNFAKGVGKKYAQKGMYMPEEEAQRPSDLPPLPQDTGSVNKWLYEKGEKRQKKMQAKYDAERATDKEIKYTGSPKYADLLTAEFYGPDKTFDDLEESERAKISNIIANRQQNLDNINLALQDFSKKNIKAGYDPNRHTLYVPPTPVESGVHSHEFSHVGDQAYFQDGENPGVGTYFTDQLNKSLHSKQDPNFLNQPSSFKKNMTVGQNVESEFNEVDYLTDPSEVKARLRALRDSSIQQGYNLMSPGYDINKYKQKFNTEESRQYDQLKKAGLSDDKINELMYLFAKNNGPKSVTAQKGAEIKSEGETSTEETPDRMGLVEIKTKQDPWYERYPRMMWRPVDKKLHDWGHKYAKRISDATGGENWYKQPNSVLKAMWSTGPGFVLEAPQLTATYAVTGKVQTPSEAMDIKNPYGALAVDIALDPLAGPGIAKGLAKSLPTLGKSVGNTLLKIDDSIYKGIPKLALNKKAAEAERQAGVKWLQDWYKQPEIKKRFDNQIFNPNLVDDMVTPIYKKNIVTGEVEPISNLSSINLNKSSHADFAATQTKNKYGELKYGFRNDPIVSLKYGKDIPAHHKDYLGVNSGLGNDLGGYTNVYPEHPDFFYNKLKPKSRWKPTVKGVTIHEGTHWLTTGDDALAQSTKAMFREPFDLTKSINKHDKYLTTPTEVHARLNELRAQYNLGPTVSNEQVDKIVSDGLKGKTTVDKRFFELLKDNQSFTDLFNTAMGLSAPVGIGLGATRLNKKSGMQKGGSIILDKKESQPNKEAMTAMMKSKIAYGDAFRNPTAMRMTNRDPRSYTFSFEDEMNGGDPAGSKGNVYVGSYGDMVVPGIQDVEGQLRYIAEPFNDKNIKRTIQQSMQFDSPEDAEYFGEHYKEVAPMMRVWGKQEMQMGGMSIPGVNGTVVASTPSLYTKAKARKKK